MDYLYMSLLLIGSTLFGYLIGSISNGVIISTKYFHKDVREYGSNNAGGTNMGRVFGKYAGLTTIGLDMLKTIISMWSIYLMFKYIPGIKNYHLEDLGLLLSGLGSVIGHCYPVFFNFKGGKAVACFSGFIIGTSWILLIVGVILFFTILKLRKMVSLSSMSASISVSILSLLLLIPNTPKYFVYFNIEYALHYFIVLIISSIILIIRHKENIKRIIKGEEKTIKWMK